MSLDHLQQSDMHDTFLDKPSQVLFLKALVLLAYHFFLLVTLIVYSSLPTMPSVNQALIRRSGRKRV